MRRRDGVTLALILLAFFLGARLSPFFLDARYLLDASSLYVETGLLALGLTLVIVCGHIDLSVASTVALVACVGSIAMDAGLSPWISIPMALLLGTLLGLVNGALIVGFRLPSFVVTVGTMAIYRGAAQAMLAERSVAVPPSLVGSDLVYLPGTHVPLPMVVLLLVALAIGVLLHRTVLGAWIVAQGTNEPAAFYSGVPTDRVTLKVFALSGFLAGLGALLLCSRLGVARFDLARGMELDAITAVVLGGASISGGTGSVLGTVLALLLVALLRTGMGVANVTAEYQLAVIGGLLILSVMAGQLVERATWRRRATNA